ncbi:MAG: hypothetical protein Q8M39_00405 [Sulfuricurvum sp.]|nr:hypothetical protein [Sulfuricurvum sp.]
MQIRELSESELEQGYHLLSTFRLDLTIEQYETFLLACYPKDYRTIGALERGTLVVYAGVCIRENLELGRHLLIDDFVASEGYEHKSAEMIDFLNDYAKIHKCTCLIIFGKHQGLRLEDLEGFRPKRDGFIKMIP